MPVVVTPPPAAPSTTMQRTISKRILELDDDIQTLKERREFGWVSMKEVTQLNRLIKLFEATIEELQAAL